MGLLSVPWRRWIRMPGREGIQEQASGLSGSGGFEVAGAGMIHAINAYAVGMGGDAIGHPGAVFPLKGCERPIGTGDHPDAAVDPQQNAEFRGGLAGGQDVFRSFEDLDCVVDEPVHKEVIVQGRMRVEGKLYELGRGRERSDRSVATLSVESKCRNALDAAVWVPDERYQFEI